MELKNPLNRVLFSPARDCNHFFHVAEVVWMLAGSNDVRFVEQFNKGYRNFADENTNMIWGAYGHRWISHWDFDQISTAIKRLTTDPEDRQVVLNMWDPIADLPLVPHNDRPCNTQIMLRAWDGHLDMLVVNRSNDLVWGALGANVVHFTYLQELIAFSAGLKIGTYRVVSNNLHVYTELNNYEELFKSGCTHDYSQPGLHAYPILQDKETWWQLHRDCEDYVQNGSGGRTKWFQWVARPMMEAYLAGPNSRLRLGQILNVRDDQWRKASVQWIDRRNK
jgi:thymidylate synthase